MPDEFTVGWEDQFDTTIENYTGGAADEGEGSVEAGESDNVLKARDAELGRYQKHLEDSIGAVYGPNADERYKGTSIIGLSAFQGHRQDRQPSYNQRGQVRGFRTAPGAPMAQVPEGLIGGRALESASHHGHVSSLTPESQWRDLFPNINRGVALTGGGGNGRESSYVTGGTETDTRPPNLAPGWQKKTITSQYGTGSAYVF
jgi:hypothetical protein